MKRRILERTDYILDACRGKRVLHIGCADTPYTAKRLADGTILHKMIEEVASEQYGIDPSLEGIELLRAAGYRNLAVIDAEGYATRSPFGDTQFDVVVAGETLEHVSNAGSFLDSLGQCLTTTNAKLLLTTINSYCIYRFLYTFLKGGENVHPDHVYYVSHSTLTRLLTRHGYAVEDFSYYPVGREHEQTLNQGRARLMWWADRFAYRFKPELADGVMVTCSKGQTADVQSTISI